MSTLRPQYLKPGDTIAVISIASSPSQAQMAANWKEQFESWGLKVKVGEHIADKIHYDFAGSHELRAQELTKMVLDPEVKAIVSIRGGYGTMHTIKYLDMNIFRENPKWIIGYSDITVLHFALQKIGLESIHGAMPGTFEPGFDGYSQNSLRKALFGEVTEYTTPASKYNNYGTGAGRLIGGNITLLRNLLSTPIDHNWDEPTVLFIEDIDEHMHKIDSKMWHLRESGILAKCKGIIVGYFTDIHDQDQWQCSVYDLIHSYTRELDIPVIFDFSCGHEFPNSSIYLGRDVQITCDEHGGKITFCI